MQGKKTQPVCTFFTHFDSTEIFTTDTGIKIYAPDYSVIKVMVNHSSDEFTLNATCCLVFKIKYWSVTLCQCLMVQKYGFTSLYTEYMKIGSDNSWYCSCTIFAIQSFCYNVLTGNFNDYMLHIAMDFYDKQQKQLILLNTDCCSVLVCRFQRHHKRFLVMLCCSWLTKHSLSHHPVKYQ